MAVCKYLISKVLSLLLLVLLQKKKKKKVRFACKGQPCGSIISALPDGSCVLGDFFQIRLRLLLLRADGQAAIHHGLSEVNRLIKDSP